MKKLPDFGTWDLQWHLVYAVLVAGKTAEFAESCCRRMFGHDELPFDRIKRRGHWTGYRFTSGIGWWLREVRTGRYALLERCFAELIQLDPATCTVEDLEAIPGIGPKTSRFFLLWTRPGVEFAALDTHVLKWLREQGYDAPKATPTGRKYQELEKAFLDEARKRGKTARELDEEIWTAYSQAAKETKR